MVPNISAFSLLFSTLSMLKTLITLNIVGIHIEVCLIIPLVMIIIIVFYFLSLNLKKFLLTLFLLFNRKSVVAARLEI